MNNIYEYCFNIVCDDWEENRPLWYDMVFEPVYYCRPKRVEEYKIHLIYDVADTILKHKPYVGNISMGVIEKMIDKRRKEIIWNKHYAVFDEDYDSDYDSDYEYTDSDSE